MLKTHIKTMLCIYSSLARYSTKVWSHSNSPATKTNCKQFLGSLGICDHNRLLTTQVPDSNPLLETWCKDLSFGNHCYAITRDQDIISSVLLLYLVALPLSQPSLFSFLFLLSSHHLHNTLNSHNSQCHQHWIASLCAADPFITNGTGLMYSPCRPGRPLSRWLSPRSWLPPPPLGRRSTSCHWTRWDGPQNSDLVKEWITN